MAKTAFFYCACKKADPAGAFRTESAYKIFYTCSVFADHSIFATSSAICSAVRRFSRRTSCAS